MFKTILLVLVALVAFPTLADHQAGHRVFVMNEPSRAPVRVIVCDNQENYEMALQAHMDNGFGAAQQVINIFNRQKNGNGQYVCGMVVSPLIITKVIRVYDGLKGRNDSDVILIHAKIRYISGGKEHVGYTVLPNVSIVQKRSDMPPVALDGMGS